MKKTIVLIFALYLNNAHSEWCSFYRDTNKTLYCTNYKADCADTSTTYCLESNKNKTYEAINSYRRPEPYSSAGDIQWCAYYRDTNKVIYCKNLKEDCQTDSVAYCQPVKVK